MGRDDLRPELDHFLADGLDRVPEGGAQGLDDAAAATLAGVLAGAAEGRRAA